MKKYIFLTVFILLQGCASKVAVMTLESTIENAVIVAQRASKGASDTLKIEVDVTTGFSGSAALPIPVVPVGIAASKDATTKLSLDIDLNKYPPPPPETQSKPQHHLFIMDSDTGILEKSGS